MKIKQNLFKQSLRQKKSQIGIWLGWTSTYTAEAIAGTGFDWLLLDGEHAPNDVQSILAQLQAVAPYQAQAVVRPVIGDTALIKQLLDVGTQTLLIPMVETAAQAAELVAATRYPPAGIRGIGAGLARAARWGQVDNYLAEANDEMCVLVQVETTKGIENLEAIAATEGVDGLFFGPSDLSASMGYLGQTGHPDVVRTIDTGIDAVLKAGKAAGILCVDPALARHYLERGATFVAVGVDTALLVRACKDLAASYAVAKT